MVFHLKPTLPILKVSRKFGRIFVCINVCLLYFTVRWLSKINVLKLTDFPDGDSWKV